MLHQKTTAGVSLAVVFYLILQEYSEDEDFSADKKILSKPHKSLCEWPTPGDFL